MTIFQLFNALFFTDMIEFELSFGEKYKTWLKKILK